MKRFIVFVSVLAVAASGALAEPRVIGDPEIGPTVTPFVFDRDVRTLPRPAAWRPGDAIKEIPRRFYPKPGHEAQYQVEVEPRVDALYERQSAVPSPPAAGPFTTPSRSFPGQDFTGVNPPDTVGDVGPSHYIQMVNSGGGAVVRIFDKAEPTPAEIMTFSLDGLGSGNCASGFGDPIVLYDRLADRWMLSEFSSSGNQLCVYVSMTGDPVSGGWFNYAYTAPAFPDYPKYGVWPTDANSGQGSYVVTANDGGPGVYALDRGAMLAGTPGTYQRLTTSDLPGFGFEASTPADLDGPTPPAAGSPAIVMRHRDTESHSGPAAPGDLLEMWAFDVDWVTPANTTLTELPAIDVADFDSDLCGLTSFFCFPQPGSGTTLDPLREIIMNRLQYMNRGDHEALIGNYVVDVTGADLGGVRWFELRREGGGWTLYQEGTYSIDSDNRWMGAIASDQSGNIALGYNISSSSTFPSLRYTGRLATDALGVMTQAESIIHAGTSANSSNRYGDYASMNLDPTDDCTFWFTGEDNLTSSWRTQIASFGFDACGCELEPSPLAVAAVTAGDNRIDVSWNDADLATVTGYFVRRSFTPGGPYATVATVPDSNPGPAGYVFEDTGVSGGSTYFYIVLATDGSACTSDPSNEASATATGVCTLDPSFDGLAGVSSPFDGICTLDLVWAAASSNCGGTVSYDVHRSETQGFMPGPSTLLVSGVTATSHSDLDALVSDASYYYIVRAIDQPAGLEDDNTVELEGIPQGLLSPGTWSDDAGDTGVAKMILDGPWQIDPAEGVGGSATYKTGTYNSNTCAALLSPELLLGSASVLSFDSQYDIELGWDKGEVQISTDGGSSWQRVPVNYPGTSTNASDNCGLPTGSYFTGADLSYKSYTADLSAWGNQLVRLRFLLSTDGSVVDNGWWIDEISVTEVDVPGTCTAGSSCADNPFVDVMPNGPLTVCEGDEQILTAGLTGGVGPFQYQWNKDDVDIPGADSSTLAVNDLATHDYNVRVRAEACPDDARDGTDTRVTWTDAPLFEGIVSALNVPGATCTIDIAWDPAASVCAGAVTYSVYRDTNTPVATSPSNLIAPALGGTTYTDTGSLLTGTTYHYVVRAVDGATSQQDANTAEASAEPSGAGDGDQLLLQEDFDDAPGWIVSTGPGPHNCGDFAISSSATQRPTGGDGPYYLSNSDACGSGSLTSTALESPAVDATIPGIQTVTLDFDLFYNHFNGDDATVEVWDGAAWQVVWSDSDQDLDQHQSLDVTAHAAGNPDFRVRFNYQNASYDWWYAIDNVEITADVASACSTSGVPGPPPATQVRVGLREDGSLAVMWDAVTCTASDYNLVHGDLDAVAAYTLGGAECAIGTTGAYVWSTSPAGDLYFLILGTNNAGTESSWGTDSELIERNGAAASGTCLIASKDSSVTCP